jgi:hypothetical protein
MNITIQPTAYQLVENATIISNKSDSVIFFQKSDGTNPDPTDMHLMMPKTPLLITDGESVVIYNPNSQAINIVTTS